MSTDPRQQLARQQAQLVAALTGDAPSPPGFDSTRLTLAAQALRRKRRRAVVLQWPELTQATNADHARLFDEYAAAAALPRLGGPLADGRSFVRWLSARGPLPDALKLRAASVDLRFRSTPAGLVRRRWPVIRLCWLLERRALVIAVKLPWLGERWLRPSWLPLSVQ